MGAADPVDPGLGQHGFQGAGLVAGHARDGEGELPQGPVGDVFNQLRQGGAMSDRQIGHDGGPHDRKTETVSLKREG